MLTNKKHIAFIDALFAMGMNQRDAYQSVYKKVTNKAADVNASKLMARPEVKAEVARRQALTSAKLNITKEELLGDLKHIKDAQRDAFPPSAIKAIELLNKMLGFNEPDKIQYSGNLSLNIGIVKPEDDESNEEQI